MVTYLVILVNFPRLLIHSLLYYFYYDSLLEDLLRECNESQRRNNWTLYMRFLWLLSKHKYFRRTFYHRIGKWRYICYFMAPPASDFLLAKMEIGPGFNAAHSFSTVINARKIGSNFTVYQDVTVGYSGGGIPVIGNNVTIYANSVVVGNITIGDNVVIGACTFVNKDIPSNSLAVGVPAVIKPLK